MKWVLCLSKGVDSQPRIKSSSSQLVENAVFTVHWSFCGGVTNKVGQESPENNYSRVINRVFGRCWTVFHEHMSERASVHSISWEFLWAIPKDTNSEIRDSSKLGKLQNKIWAPPFDYLGGTHFPAIKRGTDWISMEKQKTQIWSNFCRFRAPETRGKWTALQSLRLKWVFIRFTLW